MAPPTSPSPAKKRPSTSPGRPESTAAALDPCGALKEMSLPVLPRARLLRGLLLLMLLLGAVCGMQKKPRRPGAQPGNPLRKAQGHVQTEKNQQPEEMTRSDLTPATPSSLFAKETFGSNLQDGHKEVPVPGDEKETLSAPEKSDIERRDIKQEDDGAQEKVEMSSGVQQGTRITIPLISDVSALYGCEASVSCRSILLILYMNFMRQELPSCPCTYPSEAQKGFVSLFDQHVGSSVTWRDASSSEELPSKSARFCLRSLLSDERNTLASQRCCYDNQGRLLTRGDGVGTPELISPDFSPSAHVKLSRKPWGQCKEVWPSNQHVLPPNNGLSCPENPS